MAAGNSLGLVTGMLLATTLASVLPYAAAGADAPAPPGAAAGDTTATRAPPATGGAPSPAELAILRERVDHHVARVQVRLDTYDIRGARFDSSGVSFAPGDARGVSRWERQGRTGTLALPGPLASPVGWDRIEGITVRKPCGTRGAIAGGVAGLVAYGTLAAVLGASSPEGGWAVLVLLPLPPVGALIGAGFGSLVHRSEPGWQRSGGARPEFAGWPASAPEPNLPRAPTGAPSSPPTTGILRADLERYPVRLWLGRDGYEVHRVRLEPDGVAFDAGKLRALASPADRESDAALKPAPSSPIGWERIDRIETRRPSGRRGATWGMIAFSATALLMEVATEETPSPSATGGQMLVFGSVGAVIGAGVGSFVPHSEREWDRSAPPPAARR